MKLHYEPLAVPGLCRKRTVGLEGAGIGAENREVEDKAILKVNRRLHYLSMISRVA